MSEQPTAVYTGTEACVKCGAPPSEIKSAYDSVNNLVELQCQRCTHKWLVLPLDSTP